MSNQSQLKQFRDLLSSSLSNATFVKVSLGNYQGNDKELKHIYIRRVRIKRNDMLSFTYRYKTRDIFKNLGIAEGVEMVSNLISNDFRVATLFTTDKEIVLEHSKKNAVVIREKANVLADAQSLAHDKQKRRLIQPAGKPYLEALKITGPDGQVYKNAQDKYKQINQYIEILGSLIRDYKGGEVHNVVDMGSGKGYLTFALYDYLHTVLKLDVQVTGVEFREDLVTLCNSIARESAFVGLNFVEGTIEEFQVPTLDLLIALHACDTATDDAIFKGIQGGAGLIVVAPCCHKQIRREMEASKVKNECSVLTKYGIFMERQAEMVTDGIRALILEYCGYKTKVFEFISDAHTPKNVLIVGSKIKGQALLQLEARRPELLKKIQETKAYFGIGYHHLERLLWAELQECD